MIDDDAHGDGRPGEAHDDDAHGDEELDEETIIIMKTADPVADLIEDHFVTMDTHRSEIHLSSDEATDRVLDEITWQAMMGKVAQSLTAGLVSMAILMHPGRTMTAALRGHNKYGDKVRNLSVNTSVRIETCLAMRTLQLIQLLFTYVVPWLMIMPMMGSDAIGVHELPDFDAIRDRIHVKTLTSNSKYYLIMSDVMPTLMQAKWTIQEHFIAMKEVKRGFEKRVFGATCWSTRHTIPQD